MTLVIMAAGMGSRYGGIKQIDPMGPGGEILLDYSVYDALRAGFNRVVFIIRHDIESAFRDSIGSRFKGKIEVDYAFQELDDLPKGFVKSGNRVKPWGTGQAVLACKDSVDEPFVVINADDFYGADAFKTGIDGIRKLEAHHLAGFLVGYRLENTLSPHGAVTRGICEAQDGYLKKVTELLQIWRNTAGTIESQDGGTPRFLSGTELVSMNFWGFTPAIFNLLEQNFIAFLKNHGTEMKSEYLLPLAVDKNILAGRLKMRVFNSNARWFGITYQDDKQAVKDCLQGLVVAELYPTPLW